MFKEQNTLILIPRLCFDGALRLESTRENLILNPASHKVHLWCCVKASGVIFRVVFAQNLFINCLVVSGRTALTTVVINKSFTPKSALLELSDPMRRAWVSYKGIPISGFFFGGNRCSCWFVRQDVACPVRDEKDG